MARRSRIETSERIGIASLITSIASLGVSLIPYVAPLLNEKPNEDDPFIQRSEGYQLSKNRKNRWGIAPI